MADLDHPDWHTAEHFILGYGSLLSAASRELHSDNPHPALAVEVIGFERHWVTRAFHEQQTYVGAVSADAAILNAHCVPMNFNPKFQQRERDYRFVQVPFNQIRIVDTHHPQRAAKLAGNHVKLWICESLEIHPASAEYPVYQSYIDTCVGGCLSHAQSATAGIEQAEQFLRTTFGWQHIVNDRDKPQYPRFAPLSSIGKQTIDALMDRHGIGGSQK